MKRENKNHDDAFSIMILSYICSEIEGYIPRIRFCIRNRPVYLTVVVWMNRPTCNDVKRGVGRRKEIPVSQPLLYARCMHPSSNAAGRQLLFVWGGQVRTTSSSRSLDFLGCVLGEGILTWSTMFHNAKCSASKWAFPLYIFWDSSFSLSHSGHKTK